MKINYDQPLEDEDKKLTYLLKCEMVESVTDHLIDNTLNRLSKIQTHRQMSRPPVRIPLYIMGVITCLLILPFIIPADVEYNSIMSLYSFYVDYPINLIMFYGVWTWLVLITFSIVGLALPVHLKFKFNQVRR